MKCVFLHIFRGQNLLEMFANGSDTHGSTAVNMFELDCTPEEVKRSIHTSDKRQKLLTSCLCMVEEHLLYILTSEMTVGLLLIR